MDKLSRSECAKNREREYRAQAGDPGASENGRHGNLTRRRSRFRCASARWLSRAIACSTQKHHGGPDQAVYVYLSEDYDWWSKTLGRPIAPGTFGDNITISGLTSADLAIGDRLIAGDVVIEVTTPRIPCNTLAARMGDPGFVKAYRDAGRPGAYCRVIAKAR